MSVSLLAAVTKYLGLGNMLAGLNVPQLKTKHFIALSSHDPRGRRMELNSSSTLFLGGKGGHCGD